MAAIIDIFPMIIFVRKKMTKVWKLIYIFVKSIAELKRITIASYFIG